MTGAAGATPDGLPEQRPDVPSLDPADAVPDDPPVESGERRPVRRRCGRDRVHLVPARAHQIKLRLSDAELAEVAGAARRAGLTTSGYAAEAALAAARGSRPPVAEPWREALTEVMAARAQVRRFGGNVNQAVRALNATGEAPLWLARAVELVARAVEDLDVAAVRLAGRLGRGSS